MYPVLLGSLLQHLRPGLAALAVGAWFVRAIVNGVNRGAFLSQTMNDALMDRLKNADRQFLSGDRALVRHDDEQKPVQLQFPQRFGHAGKELHLLPRRDVLALGSFAIDHAITIEKYGSPHGTSFHRHPILADALPNWRSYPCGVAIHPPGLQAVKVEPEPHRDPAQFP